MNRPDDARETCANCGATLAGPYCHVCGQKDLGTRVELKELLFEVVSETFEIEGRLPRTVGSILVRPGHYLGEFLDGRRRSFASPLRFFLMMLFVAAWVFASVGDDLATSTKQLALEFGDEELVVTSYGIEVAEAFDPPDLYARDPLPDGCRPDLDVLPWLPDCDEPRQPVLLYSLVTHPSLSTHLVEDGFSDQLAGSVDVLVRAGGLGRVVKAMSDAALQQVPLVSTAFVLFQVLVLKLLWWRAHTSTHVVTALVSTTLGLVGVSVVGALQWWWLVPLVGLWHQLHVFVGLRRAFHSGWIRTTLAYGVLFVAQVTGGLGGLGLMIWLTLRQLTQTYA